ncbi:MAG: hypothetical protein SPE10_05635 [Paludibacteraceae bacterium]|nr:hypothetical protein [Paludibacteraceae bacterium]
MKRNLFLSLILIGCCACSNDARLLSGDYSYKTSGSVVISTDTEEITYQLPDKIGQLNVVDLKATDKDSVLLVLNEMGGSLTTIYARISADSIELQPYTTTLTITTGKGTGTYDITVSGTGIRYDDLIMLHETYDGTLSDDNKTTLYSDNIIIVANRN